MNFNERSVSLPSRTNLYIALFFCQRKAIVSRFFCERTFTTCLKPFAKLMRWVRLWEDGGVSDVNKCLKELQETCFLEYRAKFSISRSQNPKLIALLNLSVLGFLLVFHDKAKRTQQGNLLPNIQTYHTHFLKYPF